jgi:hypothetical protein
MELPRLVDIEPHRVTLEGGWVHMLNHQLPALLSMESFWNALPEIFNWLHGQVPAVSLPAMPRVGGASDAAIRERAIVLPSGTRGQTFIETIRFAAANRLVVEIDYRDKGGNRSKRMIEAYSLRRSQAGDVLLMAVRAEDGQPRSYLLDSILGVSLTQTTFSPRYPIELTPSGPQSMPIISRSTGSRIAPAATRGVLRTRMASRGPTYVYSCPVCRKLFERKTQDSTLRPHKNPAGWRCYGSNGVYVRTKY